MSILLPWPVKQEQILLFKKPKAVGFVPFALSTKGIVFTLKVYNLSLGA